ncbi:MAG TPA: hypothetical protein VM536_07035 [Chloroflexia bacterium]|nr:hypothetical protein [Chloroflexia bacterium]
MDYPRGLTVETEAVIDTIVTLCRAKLQAIGRPVYALVDDTGFHFDLRLLDYYNQAFAACQPSILATVRYGELDPWTRTVIGLRALNERTRTNIYPTRELALAALREGIALGRFKQARS